MLRSSTLNLRIQPEMRERLDRLSEAMHRPRSYIVESALAAYLDVNEWQVAAIRTALEEADSPDAVWVDHSEIVDKWKARRED